MGRADSGLGRGARTRRGGPCRSSPRHDRPCYPRPGAPEAQPEPRPGWAARTRFPRPRGAGVAGAGSATPGSRDRDRRVWWGGRRAACPFPGLWPRGPAGAAPLATCRRNAPTHPHALHGSKVKIKRITMRARLARGRRDSTSPQLRRPGGTPGAIPSPPPAATSCPGRKGTKAPQPPAQVAAPLVCPPARVCRGGRVAITDYRARGPS